MGRLIHQALGDPIGKIGNVIYRMRHNGLVAYAAAVSTKISNSQKARDTRTKLSTVSKFQSFINKIPELHSIWDSAEIDASDAYHKIGKINHRQSDLLHPTAANTITPLIFVQSLEIGSNINSKGINLRVKIDHSKFILTENEKEIIGIAVICFYQPRKVKEDDYCLNKMYTGPVDWGTERTLEIFLPFDEVGKENYYLYSKSILYFTFLTKDSTGKVVKYSGEYSSEFTNRVSKEEKNLVRNTHKKIQKKGIKRKFKRMLRKVIVKALEYTEE